MIALADNPPILTPLATSLDVVEGTWWVARTFSRCEKALAWDLVREHVPYFLPMVKRITFSGGRRRVGMAPVFSSYIFIAGSHDNRVAAFHSGHVCQAIAVGDQPELLAELKRLYSLITSEQAPVIHPQIIPGRRCRVTVGPYAGLVGRLAKVADISQVVVDLTVLGQSIGVAVEPSQIELLDEPSGSPFENAAEDDADSPSHEVHH